MEFLTGNPFCTPVGQRIEYATSLQSEDWGLNMEICDIICETEDGPKDAVRAIKKRIVGNKNFKEVMLALTVLEACVKNCGYRFHVLVSAREFVEGVLVRTILPRNDPPLVVHDRILTIIQAWADAFRSSPDLTGVVCVYEDLRRKGVMFPVAELCSPIHTPNKRFFPATGHEDPLSPTQQAQTQQQTFPFQNTEGPITLSPDEVKKLTSNLETVHGNLKVMSKIMSPIDPARSQQSHTELLKGLYSMCKEMQDQIVHLIPRVTDEKLVEQLLVANDDMNTTFTQYHSFEKRLNRQNSVQSGANLIDLEAPCKPQSQSQLEIPVSQTVSSLSSHMARLSTKEKDVIQRNNYSSGSLQDGASQESSVLDELAAASSQVQNARGDDSSDSALLGSSPQLYWMVEKGMIPVNQSDVMDNIEQWLDVDDDDDLIDEGVTSEEFDRFLAGRAKAAERLPSVKPSRNDHTPSQP
ncbi:target of Myb protein 1 isoform X1 [Ictalurus punctatus]|uniref:Target of Myb protein 1 isoform X1 n=1 Tax=Ictalurus punctatus TaxID=7998 RepID=A0A2D0QAM9_ICTPU|nr:target of Myb protein 1 isoform X1 [Ictalurus punctatus]